ncbi:MAG: DUF1206 domain-containing protein [Jatrophihabitans sp.]|uniref:DUF1206 domain-containing protein n=1 Tax=Jatrophihabitans sp. TaxID=1932789 RepID=UPI003F814264
MVAEHAVGGPVRAAFAAVARSTAGEQGARVGLAARCLVYVVLGYLVARIAGGALGPAKNDQPASGPGVAQAVAQQTGGHIVVFVLGVGLVLFGLFSVLDAVLHHDHEDTALSRWTNRVVSLWTAVLYAALGAYCVVTAFAGGTQSASKENRTQTQWSAHVLRWPGGQVWLFLAGATPIVIAGFLVSRAVRQQFREQLDEHRMSPRAKRITFVLGTIGYLGRAGLFALVGGVVVAAAIEDDPQHGKGVDGGARLLAGNPWGSAGLWLLALTLACYGVYLGLESRYRRI